MAHAGARFIDKKHIDSLFKYGFCAIVVSAQDRKVNHPEIGDTVHFLLGETTLGERCCARLVADQESLCGGCISIYAAAASIFIFEK